MNQVTHTIIKKHLTRDPTLMEKKLKSLVPAFYNVTARSIQNICKKKLSQLFRVMAAKSILTQAMKDKWLAFSHQYQPVGCGGTEGHVQR